MASANGGSSSLLPEGVSLACSLPLPSRCSISIITLWCVCVLPHTLSFFFKEAFELFFLRFGNTAPQRSNIPTCSDHICGSLRNRCSTVLYSDSHPFWGVCLIHISFFLSSPILKFSLGKVQNGLKQLYALMSEADVISVAHTTMGQMEDPPATKALGISKILKWEESAEASGVINSPHPLRFSLTRRHWWGAADSISVLSSR